MLKKGDIGCVEDVLGWDLGSSEEESKMMEDAQNAFYRIKKELAEQKKAAKEWKQKYEELARINESYLDKLHAAEKENEELLDASRFSGEYH